MSTTNIARLKLEKQLNIAVQRNGNQTVLFTNAISQRVGLSATEFECFSLLLEEGPLTAGQLADNCGLTTGGATGLINRLEKAGFVRRSRDSADRRRVIVTAVHNKKIHRKLLALYAPVSQAFDELTKNYSNHELQILIDFLDRGHAMIAHLLADMNMK